jgi:hypothetical protein
VPAPAAVEDDAPPDPSSAPEPPVAALRSLPPLPPLASVLCPSPEAPGGSGCGSNAHPTTVATTKTKGK